MSTDLVSDYVAVDLFQLREAGLPRGDKPKRAYSTYDLEFYVEYVTQDKLGRLHTGFRHRWNCSPPRDALDMHHCGPANESALRRWMRNYNVQAAPQQVQCVMAFIVRASNGEVMCTARHTKAAVENFAARCREAAHG